jgi:hypothetical protein
MKLNLKKQFSGIGLLKFYVKKIFILQKSFACVKAIFASREALKSPACRIKIFRKILRSLDFLLTFSSRKK